jgi:hypothetical protein
MKVQQMKVQQMKVQLDRDMPPSTIGILSWRPNRAMRMAARAPRVDASRFSPR